MNSGSSLPIYFHVMRIHLLKTTLKVAIVTLLLSVTLVLANGPLSSAIAAPQRVAQANSAAAIANLPRLAGKATVEMVVKGKTIIVEVDGDKAPVTAGNFVDLVQRGFYDGLSFHRVVLEPTPFVAQGGDPKGNGTGGFVDPATKRDRNIPLEILAQGADKPTYGRTLRTKPPALKHTRGAIAMARSQAPDSASSQFYFALADLAFLDGNYAVFGYVTQGMDAVDGIRQGDRITSAKVTAGAENLKP